MTTRYTVIFLISLFLPILAGCAPHHLLIERADVNHIEQRLTDWDARLDEIEHKNELGHDQLSMQQWYATNALLQTMMQEFSRLTCAPAPPVKCDGTDSDDVSAGDEVEDNRQGGHAPVLRLDDKQIIGGVEKVLIAPPGLLLTARIDTGAESASLDARNMQEFERDGVRWVRFSIMDRETGEMTEVERRIVRHVRILQSSFDEHERRPVVEFRLTLGEYSQTAEFTLSDRSHLTFPVLIGRNVLQDVMLVDVGKSHIAPPRITAPANANH